MYPRLVDSPQPLPYVGHELAVRVRKVVGEIANVVSVRKINAERRCKIILSLARSFVAISVVADIGTGPDPAGPTEHRLSYAEHYWFHTKVELRIRLLAIDDVEGVR